MPRPYNFSAGPSVLPEPVLEQVREEWLDFGGTGLSVVELSHRSKAFERVVREAEADLRRLAGIPDTHAVLFLQGGATQQFSQVPMAFGQPGGRAAYVVTGDWGRKALAAARLHGETASLWDGGPEYRDVPDAIPYDDEASYTHLTTNETISGVQFPADPVEGDRWVADASSDFLSRPWDVGRYALLYAGAQKNLGPAGLTVVIVRRDFLERMPAPFPPYLDYRLHDREGSLYHTPPAFSLYVSGLVLRHLLTQGGLEGAAERARARSRLVYEAMDGSGGFYRGHAAPGARSLMNVTFRLPDEERTQAFLSEAAQHGLVELKGHRTVGGVRASLYNAMPAEGARTLAGFMADFARRRG